ncbi:hypothetical protein GUJ93_ZPchr0010g7247 [Zizania palustris]|uniref:DCD domain-containing protein n=1 Tax=Zizania palustris TaxID=103762 RepID=A0A8J5W8K6_ZIZPA|nr:hypothetical protein GUJ93_ZPchr0010g7247 [Zizania palustris]
MLGYWSVWLAIDPVSYVVCELRCLPSIHYSYVRNVKPGLPLFLFNYSDRRLHGIFEAASPGQMCIYPYAWSHDGSLKTPFPAQVRIYTRTPYPPLLESQFRAVLSDNYYNHHHFYFELDHVQTKDNWADSDADNGSISTTSAEKESEDLVSDWEDLDDNVDLHSNSDKISQNSSYDTVAKGMELMECSHPVVNPVNGEINTSGGDMLLNSHDVHSGTVSFDGSESEVQNKPDSVRLQPERPSILLKLKELFVLRQQAELSDQNLIYSNTDQHVPEETQIVASLSSPDHHVPEETQVHAGLSWPEKHVPEETQVNASFSLPDQHLPEETQFNASLSCPNHDVPEETQVIACISSPDQHVTQSNVSLSENPFGAMVEDNRSFEQHQGNAELMKIITDLVMKTESLDTRQSKSCEEILSLRKVVKESGTKVRQLEYRIDELQFKLDSSMSLIGGACNTLDKPSIFLIGGYNGVTCLSSLDYFSPEKDILVHLTPMSSARSHASVAVLDGCLFVFGGRDGSSWCNTVERYNTMCNEWMVCPCLNHKKGGLAGVSLNGKIYVIGGGDGAVFYSDVEMFDPYLGKWICSPSMLNSATVYYPPTLLGLSEESRFCLALSWYKSPRALSSPSPLSLLCRPPPPPWPASNPFVGTALLLSPPLPSLSPSLGWPAGYCHCWIRRRRSRIRRRSGRIWCVLLCSGRIWDRLNRGWASRCRRHSGLHVLVIGLLLPLLRRAAVIRLHRRTPAAGRCPLPTARSGAALAVADSLPIALPLLADPAPTSPLLVGPAVVLPLQIAPTTTTPLMSTVPVAYDACVLAPATAAELPAVAAIYPAAAPISTTFGSTDVVVAAAALAAAATQEREWATALAWESARQAADALAHHVAEVERHLVGGPLSYDHLADPPALAAADPVVA